MPRWLQTVCFVLAPVAWVDACRRRYGDAVLMRTLFDPGFVMVFEPELVKQVFRAPPDRLRAGEANAVLGPVVGERSVLLLDGAEHLRHRKLLLPPFHGERMRAYEEAMTEAADRAIDSWPVGERFALLPSLQALTLEVIARTVFGVDEERREELTARIREMLEPVATRLGIVLAVVSGRTGGGRRRMELFEQRRARVDELIYDEIARRREAPDLEQREDILSMLLLARDDEGEPMTDGELRDELVTVLVAGHETTSTGLAWAFELLLRNPAAMEQARRDDRYLDAVVKETLRIRPVITAVGRVVREEPFRLGGHLIPPGMEINPSIAAIHRRADRYPKAREFRPERFLEPGAPDTYTWVPFGGGTRRCLGASFASFEMRVVIRRVLERAELRPAVRRRERGARSGVTYAPANGVRVIQPRPPRAPSVRPAATPAEGAGSAPRSGS
jgi:cytochrome P450 family 135